MNLLGKLVDLARRRVFFFHLRPERHRVVVRGPDKRRQIGDVDDSLADVFRSVRPLEVRFIGSLMRRPVLHPFPLRTTARRPPGTR